MARTLLFLFAFSYLRHGLLADEASQKPDRKTVEALITQLRSPNKDPNPRLDQRIRDYPKDYDFEAQKKVSAARDKLRKMGKDAFPMLIEHVNDSGYCQATSSGAVFRGQSVGEVCFGIINQQVDVAGMNYKSRQGTDGEFHVYEDYFSQFSAKGEYYTQDGLRRWWKDHQHQLLKEMQIEALRWAIAREKKIGFPAKDDQKDYLEPLEAKLRKLTGSK
jgi:hypothetical protein